ncbi:hypothetical protein [Nodularia sp. NIES-3585]|uniref:hypothetical protein n=1 Tax=Nodularia sp. NIES-3585 TaxID=1973477 RepID=UPI0015961B99|nr:hypothetical protein [Nodularia sp. NIES-3585]
MVAQTLRVVAAGILVYAECIPELHNQPTLQFTLNGHYNFPDFADFMNAKNF